MGIEMGIGGLGRKLLRPRKKEGPLAPKVCSQKHTHVYSLGEKGELHTLPSDVLLHLNHIEDPLGKRNRAGE